MKKLFGIALALASVPSLVTAQLPPIRQIGPVSAKTSEAFGQNVFVRHLKNGLLVNDVANRRLLLFDADLKNATVVADTTSATANAYSGRTANLIAFPGDSSLFVDQASMSMLVIDGAGQVKRVMALPRPQDAMVLGNPQLGGATFDASGKLVYRGMPQMNFGGRGGPQRAEQRAENRAERGAQGGNAGGDGQRRQRTEGGTGASGGTAVIGGGQGGPAFQMPELPDTSPVVRLDLKTRVIDTVVYTKIPRPKLDVQRDEGTGRVSIQTIVNPLPVVDDWAVLSDGSIAVVRGRDYHVDFIRPDGKVESAPKIPFEWQRLTDEDKVAFIDSVKAARARLVAAQTPAPGADAKNAAATTNGGGGGTPNIRIEMGPGGDGGPRGGMGMAKEPMFVQPQELPDYKPAFFVGQLRPDMDGNLWIRTIPTKGIAGGPVYDVINGKGELVERVQVPANRVIAGFGNGGVVYLVATEGDKRFIERASVK